MGYAVELYFDGESERQWRSFHVLLGEHGIPPMIDQMGFRPHVSLAGFGETDADRLVAITRSFAPSLAPFPLVLSSIGLFPTATGVAFLAPKVTSELLRIHEAYHERLAAVGLHSHPYYLPDQWVPHCTLAMELTPEQLGTAARVLAETYKPLTVHCVEIGVITYRPVVSLGHFALGA